MAMAAQLSENSHQGFEGIKAGLCLASMEAKSNTATGMPVCLWRNGIRSRSSGKERDAETGLDYFRFRYYSGAMGRWTSPDRPFADQHPADPQSWNLYAYVRNNPINLVDPDGKQVGYGAVPLDRTYTMPHDLPPASKPSTLESLIPGWGPSRAMAYNFDTGHPLWGTFYGGVAISDIFLVRSIATGIGKGAWKLGSHTWSATRQWLAKTGQAEARQHVHHAIVAQEAYKGTFLEAIFNQPWNLKALKPPEGISMDAWHKMIEGVRPGLTGLERWWYGNPNWLKAAEISGAGRAVNAIRESVIPDFRRRQ
jgi:RHS repeat-associated protein